MRIYISLLFCGLSLLSFSQVTGLIEKDTALANRNYEEAYILFEKNDTTHRSILLLEEANTLYEAHPFDEKLIEIKGLLANEYVSFYQMDTAKILTEQVFEILNNRKKINFDSSALVNTYMTLQSLTQLLNVNQSVFYGEQALKWANENTDLYFRITIDLSKAYADGGYLDELETLFLKLEDILKQKGNEHLAKNMAVIYQARMKYYHYSRNTEKAMIYMDKFLAEYKKTNVFTSRQLQLLLFDLGRVYYGVQNIEKVDVMIDELLLLNKTLPQNHPQQGLLHYQTGALYGMKGDLLNAIKAFEKMVVFGEKDRANYGVLTSRAYINMAYFYIELEDYDKAETNIEISREYDTDAIQEHYWGIVKGEKGEYEEAMKSIQFVLTRLSNYFDNLNIYKNPSKYETYKDLEYTRYTYLNKGRYFYRWGLRDNDKEKIAFGVESLKRCFEVNLLEWQRLVGYQESKYLINQDLVDILNEILIAQLTLYEMDNSDITINELLHGTERKKALKLVETLSHNKLPKEISEKEQELIKVLQSQGLQLDLAIAKRNEDSIQWYKNKVFEANQAMDKHQLMLRNDYPKETIEFYDSNYATLQDIQKELSNETLLLEYSTISETENLLIAISNNDEKIIKTDISDIGDEIKKLNELIQDRFAFQVVVRNEFIDLSNELYKKLIEPIESELVGKSKLMIVVEGQLFHLPFELLLKSNEKKPYHELDFLVKKYEINYHYSATAFLKLKEKSTVLDYSLLAFAPVFAKGGKLTEVTRSLDFMVDSLYQGIDNNGFVALPSTKKEVTAIAEIIESNNGQTKVFLKENATKFNLSSQLEIKSYQFVHIATHGLVNYKNPKLSALACYSSNERMDNLFYGNEIQFKNIDVDLVVLSSCESGIGQLVAGEGLIALNRSFIYSGAKNVLFSLWKVNDKYSSELMIDFYDNYFQNQSYTTALRNAKLKMLENPTTAQPKFWAPFVLMGE